MNILECHTTQYEKDGKCIDFQLYHGKLSDLITIEFHKDPASSEDRKDIIYTYEILSVSKKEIKFQFYFADPLLILPSDKISFHLSFSSFEKGLAQDEKINKFMTKQVPIGGIPEIEQLVDTVQSITSVAVLGTVIM